MKTFRTWALSTVALVLAVVGFAYAQPIFSNNLFLLGGNAGVTPQMQAVGTDTNISINLVPKGTGTVQVNGTPVVAGLTPTFTTLTVTGLTTQSGGEVSALGITSGITASLKASPVRAFHALTDSATTGTVLQTLHTYTLPASALGTDGQMLRITWWWQTAANANNKTGTITFGATTIYTSTAAGFNNNLFQVICDLYRTGAATQKALCSATSYLVNGNATGNTLNYQSNITTPAETLSGTVVINFTGTTPTAAGDMTSKLASVDWYPQGQ